MMSPFYGIVFDNFQRPAKRLPIDPCGFNPRENEVRPSLTSPEILTDISLMEIHNFFFGEFGFLNTTVLFIYIRNFKTDWEGFKVSNVWGNVQTRLPAEDREKGMVELFEKNFKTRYG